MGLRIVVPGASFSGPYIHPIDPTLPREGSLLLLEPGHPMDPWEGIIPASIPNLVADSAAATGFPATLTQQSGSETGLNATNRAERTSKGGLHLAHNPTDETGSSGWALRFVRAEVNALKDLKHNLYQSVWGRVTDGHTAPASGTMIQHGVGGGHVSAFRKSGFSGVLGTAGHIVYKRGSDAAVLDTSLGIPVGSIFIASNLDTALFYTQQPTHVYFTTSDTEWLLMLLGNVGFQDASLRGDQGSQIYYRVYVEDLTISGRTWEEAYTADLAEYTKQVLTEGGRYYGDTWTDPAVLLA